MLPFVKNNLLSSALLFFEQSNPGTLSNNSVIYFKIEVSPLLEQSNPGTLSNNSVIYFKSKVSPLLVKLVLSVYIFNLWIYQSSPFIEDLATDNFNTSSISRVVILCTGKTLTKGFQSNFFCTKIVPKFC